MISNIFSFFGKSVCHTIAERSMSIDGNVFSVCARCSGIYISATIAFLYFLLSKRLKGNKPPDIFTTVILAVSFLPFIIDGVTSYIGLRQSNNVLRFITGLFGGFPLPIFLILLINFDVRGKNTRPIIKNPFESIVLIFIIIAVGFLCYNGFLGYLIPQILILSGIFSVFITALYIIFNLFIKNKYKSILCSFITFVTFCAIINFLRTMMI